MRKTLKWVAVAAVVSAVALVNVKVALDADSTNEWLASLLTFTENGEDMIRHQRNDPRECTVKEAYECKLGFTIPDWVPYLGGTDCYIEYVDEVEFARDLSIDIIITDCAVVTRTHNHIGLIWRPCN